MARKSLTAAPRIEEIQLDDLTAGDADVLLAHNRYEGLRFTDVDVRERDLTGASFLDCEFVGLEASDAVLRSASFANTRIGRVNAPVFTAPRSTMRDVEWEGSRLGAAELYEAELNSVHLVRCRIGYLNLRGARLEDVLFTDCRIDELDLGAAETNRVSFKGTQIGNLDLTRSTLRNFDLRAADLQQLSRADQLKGATLNSTQVVELAPLFANSLGILVDD